MNEEEVIALIKKRLCLRHREKAEGFYSQDITHRVALMFVHDDGSEEVLDEVAFDVPEGCSHKEDW